MHTLILSALIASLALLNPPSSPPHDAGIRADPYPTDLTPGRHEVVTVSNIEFQREGRDLPLPLLVRHPLPTETHPSPFPLVVFSHGMGGYTDAFEHLSTHLASHGYVVIHPAHTDSIRLRREAGESPDSLRRTFTRAGTSVVDMRSRIDDCLWITTNLDAIEEKLALPALIDREKAAMAGHSAGAMTTQALAGLRFQTPRGRRLLAMADGKAFDAYIVISGQGTIHPSINAQSWQNIDKPMLVLSGTEDVSQVSDETPESRRHPYEFARAGDKYLIHITGATHGSYQAGAAPNANPHRIQALTTHASHAFLDLHLLNAEPARAWLTSSDPDKFEGVRAEYHSK